MNLSIGQKITNVFLQDTYIRKFISDYCLLPLYLIKDYHSVDGHISWARQDSTVILQICNAHYYWQKILIRVC